MIIEINELDNGKHLDMVGTFDVVVTAVEDTTASNGTKGFKMTMSTKDNREIVDYVWVTDATRRLISRMANLVGLYKSPVDSQDFVGRYFKINVSSSGHNGGTVYNVSNYNRCDETFTRDKQ